jgi:hypothetical protein
MLQGVVLMPSEEGMTYPWESRRRWVDVKRIACHVIFGTAFGACLWLLAAILYVLGGARDLDRYGFSLVEVLRIQLSGGAFGGLLTGVLYPLTRSVLGAGVVGYLATLPYGFMLIAVMVRRMGEPVLLAVPGALAWSFVGAAVAASLRRDEIRDTGQ